MEEKRLMEKVAGGEPGAGGVAGADGGTGASSQPGANAQPGPDARPRPSAQPGPSAQPPEKTPAPRLLIGAPASGGGKTTFTCGLLHTLVRRGLKAAACKCGPDYIDPMFHSEVIGAYSRNLDLFFSTESQVRSLVADSASRCDVTVIEGVMGFYDGIAVSDVASAWDVARVTDTPAVLVIDGRGRARSIAAEVSGFARFREDSHVAGVVLNRVSPMLYLRLKQLIEQETGVTVYGFVPVLDDCSLESRHLGLVTASEVADLRAKLDRLAAVMEETVDVEGLLALAKSAPDLDGRDWQGVVPRTFERPVRIAVAHDDAFCFYYADALRLLEHVGAELVEFSPLADAALPEDVAGLYLGGGYPELHARELSENASMLADIAEKARRGMPLIAECGGFMFLHEQLEDDEGHAYPQVGIVPNTSFKTPKLGRFGYITITAQGDGLLTSAGDQLRAHEFHYWDSENAGDAYRAVKPQSERSWSCGFSTPTMYAGYPHLYLPGAPAAAARFVEACAAYAGVRELGAGQAAGETAGQTVEATGGMGKRAVDWAANSASGQAVEPVSNQTAEFAPDQAVEPVSNQTPELAPDQAADFGFEQPQDASGEREAMS